MMRTTVKIRRRFPSNELIGAFITHVDGRSHCFGHDVPDLQNAIVQAVADLESTHRGTPAPILDPVPWLAVLASDRRVKRTALRVAGLIAFGHPGQWQGLASLGHRLGVDKRNVGHAIDRLASLGFVTRTRVGNRVYYRRTLP